MINISMPILLTIPIISTQSLVVLLQ